MASVKRFEELKSWQKARKLVNLVYDKTLDKPFAVDYELQSQIRRASGSVMHNIAEGFDAGSDKEFARFLRIARRSASEVQSQLYLALDRDYISQDDMESLYQAATEVKKLINGMLAYLKG